MSVTDSKIESNKVGDLLRGWRERRRLSQLTLAYDAGISQKHLSFLELGRSKPSREMILLLAKQLGVPLREQNVLLTAGGFANVYSESSLSDESFASARQAIDIILNGLEPNPTFAADRHWTLLAANKAVDILLEEVDPELLKPPVNILRLSLHPKGFTPQVINYDQWRPAVLEFLTRQVELTADTFLADLLQELSSYSLPKKSRVRLPERQPGNMPITLPLNLRTKHGDLSFISAVTLFGAPIDVTLSELAIESYFPANEETAAIMKRLFSA